MTTDHQKVVEALELALERHSNVEWKAGDAAVIHAALPLARSMQEKLEHYDELVAGMTWFADRLNRWGWKNHVSYVAIIQAHDCPAVIKKMLGEGK